MSNHSMNMYMKVNYASHFSYSGQLSRNDIVTTNGNTLKNSFLEKFRTIFVAVPSCYTPTNSAEMLHLFKTLTTCTAHTIIHTCTHTRHTHTLHTYTLTYMLTHISYTHITHILTHMLTYTSHTQAYTHHRHTLTCSHMPRTCSHTCSHTCHAHVHTYSHTHTNAHTHT